MLGALEPTYAFNSPNDGKLNIIFSKFKEVHLYSIVYVIRILT